MNFDEHRHNKYARHDRQDSGPGVCHLPAICSRIDIPSTNIRDISFRAREVRWDLNLECFCSVCR